MFRSGAVGDHPGLDHQAAHLDGGAGGARARWSGSRPRSATCPPPASSCSSAAETRSWPARPARPRRSYPGRADVVTLAQQTAAPAARAEGAPGAARLRRLLLHRSGGQPGLARHLPPRRRRTPDQRAVGRRGPRPRRLRLPQRPGRRGGEPGSAPRCEAAGREGRSAGDAGSSTPADGHRRRLGLERSARRDRRAHPRGQRQPGRRGARPPRRPGRAPGGLLRGRRRRRCSRCCGGSAYPTAGDRLYDGSGLSRQNLLTHRHARRRGPARHQRGPPRAATGPHRPAGRRVHRLAVLPVRQGTRRRPGPGAREDRHPHRGARAGRASPTTRAGPGWPSWWWPTGSGR